MQQRFLGLLTGVMLLGAGCFSGPVVPQPQAEALSQPVVAQDDAPAEPTVQKDVASGTTEGDVTAPVPAPTPAPKPILKRPSTKPATGSVTILDSSFSPQVLAVQAGATVVWTNKSSKDHTVRSEDSNVYDSGNIPPGGSYKRVFEWPGSYLYFSASDPKMKGTIVVR